MPDGQALAAGAEATGGSFHKAAWLTEPTLTSIFRKAFEDFRSGYVLRYTPQGVPASGWHAIDVRLPAHRSYTVRARRGYLVEETAIVAPAAPALPEVPRTLAELAAAYERGAFRQVLLGLRDVKDPSRLLRDLDTGGNPWPASPKREAAFALELVEPAVFSVRAQTREGAYELMVRFSRLIRHPLEPDVFERYWHFALLTLLEGSMQPAVTEAFVNRALERFPDEPRFALSRAIVTDQRWVNRTQASVVDANGVPTPEHVEAVRAHYAAALAFPETAVEATVRLAWFLHRIGRHREALKDLLAVGPQSITDPSLRYLRQLFLGHVLGALDRHEEAGAAYRGALAVIPGAQSARVALMNTLLVLGDRAGAESLADRILSDTGDDLDPWWMYWQGQYRMHTPAMARVRELSR